MTISGKAQLAGIMGWPVDHSLSPRLHGYWLREHGIDGAYVPLAVRPEDFEAALKMLPRLGFHGVNVTVPHKEAAADAVDALTDAARRVGAVNTVTVQADGSLLGGNTDGFGFMENLKSGAPDWAEAKGAVVVIGAGGAARAVSAALLNGGVTELRLVNRTRSRAEVLAKEIGGAFKVFSWQDKETALEDAALLVNTTTLGMTGEDPLAIDLQRLPTEAVVTDIVYSPLATPLLIDAANRGNRTVDGLGMLLHQARPGFAGWFGVEPAVSEDLRAFVVEGLSE